MSEYIRVDWESGSPFFQLVERLISRKARAWRGEPGDALGYVWEHLRRRFQVDDLIDPGKCNLATIVSRKVSNFYTRQEKTPRAGNGWVSLSEVGEPSEARSILPTEGIAYQELLAALGAAVAELNPRRRDAVLARLEFGDVLSLARSRGTTPQNEHRLAKKGIVELRTSLSRFA